MATATLLEEEKSPAEEEEGDVREEEGAGIQQDQPERYTSPVGRVYSRVFSIVVVSSKRFLSRLTRNKRC